MGVQATGQRDKLPREAVQSPVLEVFKMLAFSVRAAHPALEQGLEHRTLGILLSPKIPAFPRLLIAAASPSLPSADQGNTLNEKTGRYRDHG